MSTYDLTSAPVRVVAYPLRFDYADLNTADYVFQSGDPLHTE